jgi:hypothetical protein
MGFCTKQEYTDVNEAPGMVNIGNEECPCLNCTRRLRSMIPYRDLTPASIKLPARHRSTHIKPPVKDRSYRAGHRGRTLEPMISIV